jgi:hypothetical protein
MADNDSTPHDHDASDRKLDAAAAAEQRAADGKQQQSGPRYDPEEIRRHDTPGRDRLFADREQHDEADKNSEKNRRTRDVEEHHHSVDDDVADAGSGASAKRKS